MRILFLYFLLTTIAFTTQADSGSAYVFKVEIKYDQGLVNGYILVADYVYIDSAKAKLLYASDSLFTSLIHSMNHRDSIEVYKYHYTIDSIYATIFFKDKMIKIDASKIVSIKLSSIKEVLVGSSVPTNRYSIKDLSWLKRPFLYKEQYQDVDCRHTLFYFEKLKPNLEFEEGKKKFSDKDTRNKNEEDYLEWNSKLRDYLKILEGRKVLIRSDCGC